MSSVVCTSEAVLCLVSSSGRTHPCPFPLPGPCCKRPQPQSPVTQPGAVPGPVPLQAAGTAERQVVEEERRGGHVTGTRKKGCRGVVAGHQGVRRMAAHIDTRAQHEQGEEGTEARAKLPSRNLGLSLVMASDI